MIHRHVVCLLTFEWRLRKKTTNTKLIHLILTIEFEINNRNLEYSTSFFCFRCAIRTSIWLVNVRFPTDMIFRQLHLIVCIYFPLIVHSTDRSNNYDNDVYFEVLEPSKYLHFSTIFRSDFFVNFLAEINYTFRCRPSKEFGVKFVSRLFLIFNIWQHIFFLS